MKGNFEGHGGNIWEFAKKNHCKPSEVLDFSSNLNEFTKIDLSGFLKNNESLRSYPDTDTRNYLKPLADYVHLDPKKILLGPGLTYLIYRINQLFYGSKVAIVQPTFSEHKKSALINHSRVYETSWSRENSMENLLSTLNGINYDLLFITNPSNPVGDLVSENDLEAIIDLDHKKHALTFIDEAFIDFVNFQSPSFQGRMITDYGDVIFGRSLTKLFGFASIRLGYLLSSREILMRIEKLMEPWTVGQYALDLVNSVDYNAFKKLPSLVEKERKFTANKLTSIGFKIISHPKANFFCTIPPKNINAHYLASELMGNRILVKEVRIPYERRIALRFSVKTRDKNKALIDAIQEIIGKRMQKISGRE
ncbi:MAG: aminotransferase class I/II-fold pyridoxal phosphate-dependent enzyme [Thermoplasmatales archaeon]|nr:aminotransferase class I/II-fold pyridoxal phosphate-dependent enzyme [Thermoplasmatales archaeon]MCW6171069.1 aminotransferase class I/II-fold pyridoxal phosphate-dependent enzyme [Thermoplasmatales archaeon]